MSVSEHACRSVGMPVLNLKGTPEPTVVTHTFNHSTWEEEARKLEVQGHSQIAYKTVSEVSPPTG